MKSKQAMFLMLAALLMASVVATSASADQFIKQVTNTDAMEMMGQKQPATSDTSSIWLTDGKAAMQAGDGKVYVFVVEGSKLYAINHAHKTFAEMSTDMSELTDDMSEEETEQAKAMKAMAEQMTSSMKVTVTPTEETKKIGSWNTAKYVMDVSAPMGNTKIEMWTTQDIEADYTAFMSVAAGARAMMPGYNEVLDEMKKVKGITVYSVTEMSMMGSTFRSTLELIEAVEKDAPEGTFDIPEGYKKVDMMEMAPGQ